MDECGLAYSPICIACTYRAGDKSENSVDEQFERQLQECADSIRDGMMIPKVFKSLTGNVKQAALSQSFLCLLFEDGTVCRIQYTTDDSIEKEAERTNVDVTQAPSVKRIMRGICVRGQPVQLSGNRGSTFRSNIDRLAFNAALSASGNADVIPLNNDGSAGAYSIRVIRSSNRSRHGATVLLGNAPPHGTQPSQPVIPAQNVPEELIEEAQAVLQGKSRNTIIRELQRTNLDINVAVNNLLGRDEDMEDVQDDDQFNQVFSPFADFADLDITSSELHPALLLDSGDPRLEDTAFALRCASLSRRMAAVRGEAAKQTAGQTNNESSTSKNDAEEEKSTTSKINEVRYPLKFSPEVEWCKFKSSDEPQHFIAISSMHSELLLISAKDESLVQWSYNSKFAFTDNEDPSIHHPRARQLNIQGERIGCMNSTASRAVLITRETEKICSFVDESLGKFAMSKIDFPATRVGISSQPINCFTSCYFSAALCDNDKVFWWGALPRKSRIKVLERAKDRSKRESRQRSDQSEICINSLVVSNCARFIQIGAVGYIVKDGIPKIGQLLDTAISTDSTYRFLVRNDISKVEDILDISELTKYEERHSQTPTGSKRKRSNSQDDTDTSNIESQRQKLDPLTWYEENWHIADVIFIDECKITPLGNVVMVDKSHVVVKLTSNSAGSDKTADSSFSELENARIFRKDDLRVFSDQQKSFLPNSLIKYPKRVAVDFGNPIAMCLDNDVLHCISIKVNCTAYLLIDIVASKIIKIVDFPFALIRNPSIIQTLSVPHTSFPLLLRDFNMCPIQLRKSFSDTILNTQWKNIMPFSSYASVVVPLKPGDPFSASGYRVISFATQQRLPLMSAILRLDVERIVSLIYNEGGNDNIERNGAIMLEDAISERCDGDRNILHVALSLCFPTTNKSPRNASKNKKEEKKFDNSNQWTDTNTEELTYLWTPMFYEPKEIESRGRVILKCILETDFFNPALDSLLTDRNVDGHTPFMYAVYGRAYGAAIDVLDKIVEISHIRDDKGEFFRKAIYPIDDGAKSDDNPMFMLLSNDTCSYTWTGEEHIAQTVYKCFTCNIQGTRCCCAECANICHRGHDCRVKSQSPTAYCDCWETGRCKGLIMGDQKDRSVLFTRLLKETDLISNRNSKNEPLLLFLAQTAARQIIDQRQFKGSNRTVLRFRRSGVTGTTVTSVPGSLLSYAQALRRGQRKGADVDLTPPTFCADVLDEALRDHNALRSVFYINDSSITDRFVLVLLTRLSESLINQFMLRLEGNLQWCVHPFIESTARVIVYLSMVTSQDARGNLPIGILSNFHSRVPIDMRSRRKPLTPLYDKAKEIFAMHPTKSVEVLVDIAESLIAPLKAGIVDSDSHVIPFCDIKQALQALDDALCQNADKLNGGPLGGLLLVDDNRRVSVSSETPSQPLVGDTTLEGDDDNDDLSTISFAEDELVEDLNDDTLNEESYVAVMDDDDDDEEEEDVGEDDAGEDDGADADVVDEETIDDNESEASSDSIQSESHEANEPTTVTHQESNNPSGTQNPLRTERGMYLPLEDSNLEERNVNGEGTQGHQSNFAGDVISSRTAQCIGYAIAMKLIYATIASCDIADTVESFLSERLASTWSWLCNIMNSTELALRQGVWLHSLKSPKHAFSHPLRSPYIRTVIEESKKQRQANIERNPQAPQNPNDFPYQTIRHFLVNIQTLWRSNSLYQQKSSQYFNLSSFQYVVYILDSMLTLQLSFDTSEQALPFTIAFKRTRRKDNSSRQLKRDPFFRRTNSTVSIGLEIPDPIKIPVSEALPLVSLPQLLQPDTYRDELWYAGQPIRSEDLLAEMIVPSENARTTFQRVFNTTSKRMPLGDRTFLMKWRLSIDAFTRMFMDGIGQDILSVLPSFASFQYVEAKFRQEAERLRGIATKEIRFDNVERTRTSLIFKLFRSLNVAFLKATTTSTSSLYPLLGTSKVRVSFKDEPGEGVGVTRSFYTSVINELLSTDPLPPLDSCQALANSRSSRERRLSISPMYSRQQRMRMDEARLRNRRSLPNLLDETNPNTNTEQTSDNNQSQPESIPTESTTDVDESRKRLWESTSALSTASNYQTKSGESKDDNCAMFWKPQNTKEFFAPRPSAATFNRTNAFRNVGRLIGLCLLNNDILPLFLCRHVIKYILNREISWHDLAFFDSTLYESIRQVLLEVESDHDISELGLNWIINLRQEEGGGIYELCENGATKLVTNENCSEYVKAYTQARLITIVEPFLRNLRMGVLDVLPSVMLSNLTAEEFRLLLNGSDRIDVKTLYSYTNFVDETGEENTDRLERFKKWFWTVVEGMSPQKRQDLVLFWTGSPTLPSSAEGFQAAPSITIRHPDDLHLPTANTCISRLYIPLYSTKRILRQKLTYAIRAKNFGFI